MSDDDGLGDHVSKREVMEAFNHMGQEWNQALGGLSKRLERLEHLVDGFIAGAQRDG